MYIKNIELMKIFYDIGNITIKVSGGNSQKCRGGGGGNSFLFSLKKNKKLFFNSYVKDSIIPMSKKIRYPPPPLTGLHLKHNNVGFYCKLICNESM